MTARKVSWTVVMRVAQESYTRGSAVNTALGSAGRSRLLELVRKSKGRPANLSKRERDEVQKLASKALSAARRPEQHRK